MSEMRKRYFMEEVPILEDGKVIEIEDGTVLPPITVINCKEGQILEVDAGEQKARLNDFLPEGVEFAGSEGARYNFDYDDSNSPPWETIIEYKVRFPLEEINSVKGRLGLLHEMGHAANDLAQDAKGDKFRHLIRGMAYLIRDKIVDSPNYKNIEDSASKNEYYIKQFKKRWRKESYRNTGEGVPYLTFSRFLGQVDEWEQEEYDAWTRALEIYKRIKKETSIDLLRGATNNDIFNQINFYLARYEELWGVFLEYSRRSSRLTKLIKSILGR